MTYTAAERRKQVDSEYRRRYELARYRGIPTSPLPADRARHHIQALYQLGWSYEAIAHAAGTSDSAILLIGNGTGQTIHRATARALTRVPYTLAPTDNVPDTCLIPSLGAQRRVRALLRLGWRHSDMKQHSGGDTTQPASGVYRQMRADKWRRIDRLYRDLHMTPGPSSKTLVMARNLKYAPPLGWLNIDDPDEKPLRNPHENARSHGLVDRNVVSRLLAGERMPSTRAEKREAMRVWLERGNSERSLCEIHGWRDGRYTPRGEDAA